MKTISSIFEQWQESLISDYELITLLDLEHNTRGAIEEGQFTGYDYDNQEWIVETK